MRLRRIVAFTTSFLAALTTVGAATASAAPPTWQSCPDNLAAPLQCTTVTVPLDYRDPGGTTIDIAVSRLKATNPQTRRGVLLVNPGGPGEPGLAMPLTIARLAPQSLTDSYDIIGFDPRGTGHSAPISCELTPDQLNAGLVIPYPAPDGDISGNVAFARQVAQQCAEHAGAMLPYITTRDTARDMDRIRTALGESKISYLGYSYGSYLGAAYTTMFPDRSDRIVLDSVVDPRHVWRSVWQHWGPSTEERFPDFAKWAAQRDPTYQLGSTPEAVRATYFQLAAKLDAHPVQTVTGNVFRATTRSALYADTNFAQLAKLWQAIDRGDLGTATQTADFAAAVDPTQSIVATLWGVVCDDTAWPTESLAQQQREVLADKKHYPLTNGMPSNVWPCEFWPDKPIEPPVQISDHGPANVLLVQNQRDPATPLFGAVAMRQALGQRARMVTADQGGHGAYLVTENACISNTATSFLVGGTLPARDVSCGATAAPLAADPQREQLVRDLQARQFPF